MPRGGARPGAGRKPDLEKVVQRELGRQVSDLAKRSDLALAASKPPELIPVQDQFDNPEDFFRAVMNSAATEGTLRLNAAKALAALKKPPAGATPAPPKAPLPGKKAQRSVAAKAAAAALTGEDDDDIS